jgi:hypothetical protein
MAQGLTALILVLPQLQRLVAVKALLVTMWPETMVALVAVVVMALGQAGLVARAEQETPQVLHRLKVTMVALEQKQPIAIAAVAAVAQTLLVHQEAQDLMAVLEQHLRLAAAASLMLVAVAVVVVMVLTQRVSAAQAGAVMALFLAQGIRVQLIQVVVQGVRMLAVLLRVVTAVLALLLLARATQPPWLRGLRPLLLQVAK